MNDCLAFELVGRLEGGFFVIEGGNDDVFKAVAIFISTSLDVGHGSEVVESDEMRHWLEVWRRVVPSRCTHHLRNQQPT